MGPRLLRALLHRVASAPADSDAELLARFAATRDEPAFAELVRRYGGLVWGQCRNLLPNEADAEDAFQATFLVLARRPGAVRSAVGPYLHGIAYRVCLNTRRLAGRRKKREVASATSEAERPVADSLWDAALATVHAELHRLPGAQREAFVLCVLEGRGLTDTAEHLGVRLGTLSARLSRAKQTLMDRLAAKGVMAGIAVATALAPAGVTAAVAAKAVQSAVGVASDAVLSLTHGVTKMVTFKAKVLAAGVLLACGLGLGVGSGWVATAQDKPKAAPPAMPADTRARELEREVGALEAALLKAQTDLAKRPVAPAQLPTEFKYLPLKDNAGTVETFEKLVKDGEKGGYTFAGSVPMRGFKNDQGQTTVTALVFRRQPAKAEKPATTDLLDYKKPLLLRYDEQKQADLILKKRHDELTAEQVRILDQAKAAQAREAKMRAEIADLEARIAAKKPSDKPVQFALKNGNEVGAAVRAAAAIKYGGRPTALKVEVNWNVVSLTGDEDAVTWAAKLVGELTK